MRVKMEARCRMTEILNGRMQDKNTLVGTGFAHFDRGMRDSFKIDGGMQDEKQKITC